MKQYTTTQRVRHEGRVFNPGTPIELNDTDAAALGTAVEQAEPAPVEKTEPTKPTRQAAAKKPAASKSEGK